MAPNRRIDSRAPSSASGGMIALTRLPSASRASTIGQVSSTRRPTRPTIRWMIWIRCRSSLNATFDRLQPALALDVDDLRPVDQDVADRRVAHQGLERAQAERLVEHFADQPLALAEVEQVRPLADQFLRRAANFQPQFVLVHRADDRKVHSGDELLVQLPLDREEPIFIQGREPRLPVPIRL